MTESIAIGRKLLPLEHIALVEPFDPASQAKLQSQRPFQTRIVLIDRESVLTEEAVGIFVEKHGFRALSEDGIAINSAIHFSVEAFEAEGDFKPTKAYRTRLLWRDQNGQSQSKLLVAKPETVLAIAVRGESMSSTKATGPQKRARSRRKRQADPVPA